MDALSAIDAQLLAGAYTRRKLFLLNVRTFDGICW
jgi:hypothetical protein